MIDPLEEGKRMVQAIKDKFDCLGAGGDPAAVEAKRRVEEANNDLRRQTRNIPDRLLV